jgi:FkbM family methyltransferase
MNDTNFDRKLKILGQIVRETESNLSFTILEIGALPLEGEAEPFHKLLDLFPDSKVIAFEVENNLCEQLNEKANPGITYYPVALGRSEEKCTFYETNHPMCCSLYKPNEKLISMYNNMEVAMLKSVCSIDTVSLDYFMKNNNIDSVDFIKIDIQGAELDVFKGGVNTLQEVVAIVSEVEFIPHYIDQPLFGDVCSFLTEKDLMFHKFLGMAGRTLKPIIIGNNPNYPTQHMWSDAVFIKNIFEIPKLSSHKLLKLGLLSFIYGSPDVTFQCFKNYDEMNGTNIHKEFLDLNNKVENQELNIKRKTKKKRKTKGLR